jgi:hypothetical protein
VEASLCLGPYLSCPGNVEGINAGWSLLHFVLSNLHAAAPDDNIEVTPAMIT